MKRFYLIFFGLWLSLAGCGSGESEGNLASNENSSDETDDRDPNDDAGEEFTVHYQSPWASAYVHFDDGSGWTTPPGVAMTPEGEGWFVFKHARSFPTVELVFNDGADVWDNNGELNYKTDLREFWIVDGQILDARPVSEEDPKVSFCDTAQCGSGTCNEEKARCECAAGSLFDAAQGTCVVDACAGVMCGFGELCDPEAGKCLAACTPNKTVGDFQFCVQTTKSSYAAVIKYTGSGALDLGQSEIRVNERKLTMSDISVDMKSQTLVIRGSGLEPSKYSVLLRTKTASGTNLRPLFIPMWIGEGLRYADFGWRDAIMYQVMTDRFLDGDPTNNLDNSKGSLSQVDDVKSRWQGGDFRGITEKIKSGYFTSMGINALWISSPLLNSHASQPAVKLSDNRRFSSYHSYHPIVTGYTHLDHLGYDNPIETAFGTPEELHELVAEAHRRGIRVVPDFVANHVQIESALYKQKPDWFFKYNPCDGNWDAHRLDCWFTTDTPDFDYSKKEAVDKVVDHALWLIQEFNFDGFRADALKHMNDDFVRALKKAVIEQVETTVEDHAKPDEATVFYMVGESLGGWARYHVRADMVQGQVDEEYYNQVKNALLRYGSNLKSLAGFAIPNDTAYRKPQATFSAMGGYDGAVMGNFFGNHDQVRALTEASGDHARLRLAQAFLMTSPGNIPMLYQGDDIGTLGGEDPDNRKMHRFDGLSGAEKASLNHVMKLGMLREAHKALRRGARETVALEDFFWVYKVSLEEDLVYVVLNRDGEKRWDAPQGYVDGMGNCASGMVPAQSACVFVKQ